MKQEEKKVEYLELIYDLIFVYIIGRNNSLLHHVENGFVDGRTFFAYILCTLTVIQIWNFSTFYINLYGKNGVRDHVFLFINMYLLYHMADGISVGWQSTFYRFCAAWALILINTGIQHVIELKNHKDAPWECVQLKRKIFILFSEAALVAVHAVVYSFTSVSIAYVPIAFGIIATAFSGRVNRFQPVDFAHLAERAMLYVVFTFGEMIISIASYFSGELTGGMLYFSATSFLIVVGLFLGYEIMYNRIIDKERTTNGTGYMMIHVFLIFALNNISVSLEFMREEEVDLLPKTLMLTGSFVLYFLMLFLVGLFAKRRCLFRRGFIISLILVSATFIGVMLLFRTQMYLNIAISVAFVFGIFLLLLFKSRKLKEEEMKSA